ncbi:MAG: hypothetical protein ACI9JY_003319, partial [Saprospiraceae bacterium]
EDEIILKSKFYKKKLDARKNKLKKNSNGCLLMCIF